MGYHAFDSSRINTNESEHETPALRGNIIGHDTT